MKDKREIPVGTYGRNELTQYALTPEVLSTIETGESWKILQGASMEKFFTRKRGSADGRREPLALTSAMAVEIKLDDDAQTSFVPGSVMLFYLTKSVEYGIGGYEGRDMRLENIGRQALGLIENKKSLGSVILVFADDITQPKKIHAAKVTTFCYPGLEVPCDLSNIPALVSLVQKTLSKNLGTRIRSKDLVKTKNK